MISVFFLSSFFYLFMYWGSAALAGATAVVMARKMPLPPRVRTASYLVWMHG